MRVSIQIHVDDAAELETALRHVADNLPASTFQHPDRGFMIEVSPSYDAEAMERRFVQEPLAAPALDPDEDNTPLPQAQDAVPAKAPRTRRTKAQIEADNLALARASAANGSAPPVSGPVPGGSGVVLAPGVEVVEDDDAPASPAEAKLKALEILRECYTQSGGPGAIKQVQKDFAVAKFMEVPDDKGFELYERAVALQGSLNL